MTEKYIPYNVNGEIYDVPESESAGFEKQFPSATIEMHVGEDVYDIPLSEKDSFLNQYSNAVYSFDKDSDKDRTTVVESAGKGLGSGLLRATKGAWDLLVNAAAGSYYIDPHTGIAERLPSYEDMIKEGRDEIKWSQDMRATADRLSKEADPTRGEKGYGELLKEGKIGTAAQKALAQGAESLPMMIAAGTGPVGMSVYGSILAASNYADQTIDNPEIEAWKRGVYSVGTAATELLVEKIGGPLKKIIGKGGSELTEQAAKEFIEKLSKEGSETIAKRIFGGLGKILKEGAEEGGEEVLTAFGNDALGEALDSIEGNKDYGIRAQWEQYQKDNPDADMMKFAQEKGKEYWESFLGGALSGAEISGTVESAKSFADAKTIKEIQGAREAGANLDYENLYDTDDIVRDDLTRVAGSFTNENGEQAISSEFVEMLSSDDAYRLSQNEDLSGEQRSALSQLAIDKARQEGLTKALDDRLNNNINASRILVEEAAEDDGSIIVGIFGDRPVYIKGGVVNNGSVTLYNGQRGPVIAYDVRTGEQMTVRSDQVTDAVVDNAENFANTIEEGIRMREQSRRDEARNTMSPLAKFKAVQPFAGKKMMVDLGNGITEVDVLQVLPQSQQVVIKGKKADLGGQSITKIGADVFYDSISRDDDGNPMFVEGVQETEATEQNSTEDVDYRGENVSILINGVPTNVEVVSQDTPSDTIVYEYTDENGNSRRGSSTIGAFQSAIQGAQDFAPEVVPETVPETPVAETPTEDTPEITEEPAPHEEPEQIQLNPEDIDWDALFEQDPWAYFSELQNQFGEGAIDFINNEIAATEEEIAKLEKHKGGSKSERVANLQKKSKLKLQLGTLYEMLNKLSSSPATEVAPEAPVAEIPTTEVTEEPAPVEDVPVSEAPEPAPVEETPTETPVAETPTEPQPTTPVAPTPVDNPVEEAKAREEALDIQLKRAGIPHAQKQDIAFNAGKAVGDMFATREEYEDYLAIATNLGEYNADFERGVEASFANRSKIESIPQINEVPLENEPNGDINGEQGETTTEGSTEGRGDNTPGEGNDTGSTQGTEGNTPTKPSRTGKGKGGKKKQSVAEKYPTRKGNATQKLLVETFGFSKVTIPNTKKETLNSIYDFLMEMSKMLGISPKSIGQGGWLGIRNLNARNRASARHQIDPTFDNGTAYVEGAFLEYKHANLSGIAHEWWHSLDRALVYSVNGGRVMDRNYTDLGYATKVEDGDWFGRKETLEAAREVLKAIENSGHIDRLKGYRYVRSKPSYWLAPTEMAARAFDVYIIKKFEEAGIKIEGVDTSLQSADPTPEEMAVIAPAFDNLFKVLQEKEGKKPGTSILYHIGEEMEQNTEAKRELGMLVADWIQQGGSFVIMDTEAFQEALSQEGISQNAKRPRRTIINRDLSSAEKRRIQEYILTLPQNYAKDRPYLLMTRNYAYVFNTLPSRYEENTTQRPVGDGFEILHKKDIRSLTAEQKKELERRYNNDEERRTIDGWLQDVGDVLRGLPESVSNPSDSRAGNRDANLDEGQDREQATSYGRDTGSLRYSGKVQKLETADGVIYGFVKDGIVYLNPTLLNPNTAIHEYTHLWDNALMQLNRPLWEKGKALMKKTSLWNEVINDPNYADIKDNEDLVASEVHSRLVGTKGAAKLEQLEQEARAKGLTKGAKELSILGRLREWLNEATKWLKDAFSGTWSKEDLDKVTLTDFLNMPLRDLANFMTLPKVETGVVTNENGEVIADNNGNGHIQFSIKTWREGGRDYLASWLDEDNTLSEDEKADILARMDEFYENAQKYTDVYVPFGTWSEAAVKYDKDGNPLMSVIKANGDYAMNLDFSLVCKKRRPLNLLLRELINRNAFGTYTLRERELAEINWILQEHGFEVACALCFVDSKRYRVTGVADVFATLYNRFVKALAQEGVQIAHFNYSNNPNVEAVENGLDTLPDEQLNWKKFDELAKKYGPKTVEGKVAKFLRENPSQRRLVDATDFIDAKGFEAVKEGNPALLSLYNSKKGTGGPKASFGDVQYLNDILKKDKAFDVEKAYSVGGVRLQSFSDFVPHMYFDYMQLFAELAAKKLPAHAYTKEVLFAKIFGMTGLKINMSLVPSVVEGGIAPGLDAEGNYTWADAIKDKDGNVIQQAQSFPFDDAMAIQNAEGYSKNCGVIAVGISDEHIEKMLDDPNIPYIIPYHKSSLNAIVARMTNIDQYKDYTKVQNTRKANGSKLPKGTPDFNFNAYLHENPKATPQDAAQAYLDWCKKNKYKPKFSQFAYHPNYYKLLQDFNTMDSITGEYAPQGPVTMTFPTEQNAFGNVETLIQQGLKEDAELEEKFETDIKVVADEVEQRLEEIKAEPQLTGKKYEQHLDKIVGDRMAKIKKMSEATADEYGDGILSRSGDITPEMDAEYLAAVERGDMETAQRMVNEAADKYLNETLLPNDEDEVGFKYHRGPAPAKTFKRYAVLNVTPEGFKAAYAGNKTGTPVGVWLDAQNLASYTSDTVQFDDGTFATYIAGDTGAATNTKFSPERAEELGVKGGQRWLLERGGKHSSDVPNFSQMNLKVNENGEKVSSAKDGALPHNKLIFEIEYGISEEGDLTDYVRENGRMMKGKNQGLAKIGPNQYYDFKTNPNAVGNWGIGGTFRITRLVPHSEVVSVTEQYKKDAIAEANRLYEKGEISKKDRDARVKSAESIQVQKWVGGYNPADFGLSEEIVKQMAEEGSKMKLTDPVTYDDAGNVIPLSERFNPEKRDIRYRKSDIQNAAADYLAGPQRAELIQRAVNEEATKLGVTVTYKTREEMPNGHKNDKGYYNTKTGEIVVCTENNADINDAIKTIIHETVAHKGLRNLMGDRFNEFINRVYDALDAETKAKVDALADKSYNGNKTVAMEEYMASLAETEDFANTSVWEKIKDIFNSIINSILGRNDIKIGDNELRYILRASYANMVNPRNMETIDGWAKDTNMRNELGINEATPEIMSRTGIDPTEVARESARTVYDRVVNEQWQEFQRQFQDAMQPVRIAIDAIQQETGNIPIEDYENYLLIHNQASSRSRVEIDEFASKYYSPIIEQVNHMIDMIMEMRGWDVKDKKRRAEVYAEVRQYLIAKHGLERNKYYQETKKRPLNKAEREEKKQEAYDMYQYELSKISSSLSKSEKEAAEEAAKTLYESELAKIKTMTTADLRDYSGLTALFGYDPAEWEDAEAEAQRFVDNFERSLGRVDHLNDNGDIVGYEQSKEIIKLWEKINKATDKTLRHSYESGLISRSQYEYIKSMFGCYIPLRGFDETTAEDVYAYARFEGNRFNPAVYKAEGRTSVADDPLAIIMNMAESEIAQGNKNRAKQALYNFLLNRPVTGMDGSQIQNSLMQVEDVWYIKTVDENGNEVYTIAAPDHESGETYEEFEDRMRAIEGLETSDETDEGEGAEPRPVTAFKSKKGQVDVGMRFQKQMNRNAHYVYLKVNGVDKAIYINGDPKAAEAINGSYRPKPQFGEGKFREINRIISSMFTNYSLPFTIRNFARDMFYSHININMKESDPAYRKSFRRNWGQSLFRVGKMLYDYRNGKFEGVDLNEYQAAFVDFMQNGGQTGYTVINSVENHKKDLERAIKNIQKGIKKGGVKDSTVFKLFLGWVEFINETAELVTRFSAYKTSRDMGRGVVSAINDAKEITVNFNTKGAQDGRGWMGFVSQYFGWSKFFFNASIQGVQNLGAMAQANKLKFCTTVGGIMATGFLMPVITSLVHALMGGDDEEEYWNIPEYDRQNNLCIVAGDDYVKVPLPIGFREMYAIGDMVAAMAFDKKFKRDVLQTGKDMANKVASVVLPINPLESSANRLDLWQTGLYFVLPSSTQFAVQNATNIDWKGTPLQKEYTYNENDPQWMKAFESNPDWMTGLSKWCNEHIHPDGSYSGWDWSPEKLDNTLSNVFGGIYNVIKQTGRYISKAASGDWSISNLPIASVAYGSGLDDDNMYITDAYFDMKEYYDKNVNYIKRRAKKFGYDLDDVFLKHKGQHHPKMQEIYSDRNYDFMEEWYKGDDELKKLNDKIKKLEKEIAGTENPTTQKIEKLAKLKSEYDIERREFVEDMLELD